MLNFNGGTAIGSATLAPLGVYAGLTLFHTGNFWISIGFLLLACIYLILVVTTMCRYWVNYSRNRHLLKEY